MLRVSYRVFCRVAFCSFCLYTCNSKSIAGVPKGLFRATLLLRTTRMCSQRLGGLAVWRLYKQTSKQTCQHLHFTGPRSRVRVCVKSARGMWSVCDRAWISVCCARTADCVAHSPSTCA